MGASAIRCYTSTEYLTMEGKAAYRSEYLSGEIFAIAGNSFELVQIV